MANWRSLVFSNSLSIIMRKTQYTERGNSQTRNFDYATKSLEIHFLLVIN